MISFEELEYYYNNNKEKFNEWVNKSTFELDYYTKEGQLLILINTYKIENYIVDLLNEHFKDANIKFSHYDEFFRYYYPELKHSNGPDIKVITDEGKELGTLTDVIETGSNDVYVVSDGKSEVLIPAIHDCIVSVSTEDRLMTVHLLPGLVED